MIRIVVIPFFFLAVQAQQAGTIQSENHPSLTWETCTSATSCSATTGKITLDANYRWLHHVNFTSNCFTGGWNASTCPDNVSCAKNCALGGTDYAQSAAVRVLKNELRLTYSSTIDDPYHFTSRLFLLSDDTHYQLFNLLNKEISFTVDTSRLPCGLSASVKLLSMDEDGGVARFPGNKVGAKYGTGYCDAKCSRDVRFVDGKANVESWTPSPNIVGLGAGGHGSCCMEVNVFEGNSVSNTLAAHSCDSLTSAICSGDGCLSKSPCDAVGCDLNPYRMGFTSFFGPGKVVDTNKLLTVVTQFLTTDGTNSGTLKQVKRFYIQNGVKISTPDSSITGTTGNSLTSSFCAAQKSSFSEADSFSKHSGLEAIGKALAKGMVLAMSLNDGGDDGLEWLDGTFPATATPTADGVKRGPCEKQGSPASLQTVSPRPVVSFGKIRVGDLGSTG